MRQTRPLSGRGGSRERGLSQDWSIPRRTRASSLVGRPECRDAFDEKRALGGESFTSICAVGIFRKKRESRATTPAARAARPMSQAATVESTSVINLDPNVNARASCVEGIQAVAIAAGGQHCLALTRGGNVVAWGNNARGQTTVPDGLRDVVALACGFSHSLAVRSDGTVVAWGNNARGATNVPAGLADVVAVAGGGGHSVALKRDGTVVAWGDLGGSPAAPPAGLDDVVAIASGWEGSLALRGDGSVAAWGSNQLGPVATPHGFNNITAIAAGATVAPLFVGSKTDGSVTAGGGNGYSGIPMGLLDVPTNVSDVVQVAAGEMHCVALTGTGEVITWGDSAVRTTVPNGLADVVSISAGADHTLAMRKDGTVVAWGKSAYGQCDLPVGLNGRTVGWDGHGYDLF